MSASEIAENFALNHGNSMGTLTAQVPVNAVHKASGRRWTHFAADRVDDLEADVLALLVAVEPQHEDVAVLCLGAEVLQKVIGEMCGISVPPVRCTRVTREKART